MQLRQPRKPQESKVMKYVNLAGTAVMLNLLFLLACVPVVTIGPALCGLYSGVRYMIRDDGPVRGFWEGFKTNFLRMTITGIVFTAIMVYFAIMINGAYNTWIEHGVFRDIVVYSIPAIVPMLLLTALVALNIYVPYDVTDWLRNGVNLVFKAPLWVLLSAILLVAPVVCLLWATDIFILAIVIFVGFWFAITAFVSTLLLKDGLVDLLLEYQQEHPEDEEEMD